MAKPPVPKGPMTVSVGGVKVGDVLSGSIVITVPQDAPESFMLGSGAVTGGQVTGTLQYSSGFGLRPLSELSSGALRSGSVISGLIPLASGSVGSWTPQPVLCSQCGTRLPVDQMPRVEVNVWGVDRFHGVYCFACAGWDAEKRDFQRRIDWVRETVPPYLKDAPPGILADWLEEYGQHRERDVEYLRRLCEGG